MVGTISPELLAPTDACLPATLDRGERRRLGYDTDSRPDVANVRGLRVLWALEPTSDVALVAASHKTHDGFRPPSLPRMEEMGATTRLALAETSRSRPLRTMSTCMVGAIPQASGTTMSTSLT